jgi:hypothetical protein
MAGILVSYARVSTCHQPARLAAEVGDLRAAGCKAMFAEQAFFVRRDATLAATKFDKLAQPAAEPLRFINNLDRPGSGLTIVHHGSTDDR